MLAEREEALGKSPDLGGQANRPRLIYSFVGWKRRGVGAGQKLTSLALGVLVVRQGPGVVFTDL